MSQKRQKADSSREPGAVATLNAALFRRRRRERRRQITLIASGALLLALFIAWAAHTEIEEGMMGVRFAGTKRVELLEPGHYFFKAPLKIVEPGKEETWQFTVKIPLFKRDTLTAAPDRMALPGFRGFPTLKRKRVLKRFVVIPLTMRYELPWGEELKKLFSRPGSRNYNYRTKAIKPVTIRAFQKVLGQLPKNWRGPDQRQIQFVVDELCIELGVDVLELTHGDPHVIVQSPMSGFKPRSTRKTDSAAAEQTYGPPLFPEGQGISLDSLWLPSEWLPPENPSTR